MSYVIQNFFFTNKFVNATPRLKALLIFNNLANIVIFLKLNNFVFSFDHWNWKTIFFFRFYKTFFTENIYKFFWLNNFKINHNYPNNLTNSLFYWNFKLFNLFINQKASNNALILWNSHYVYNSYFYPVRTANPILNFKIYKNFFFFLLLKTAHLWNHGQLEINFHKNFLFNTTELFFFFFYNGPFFKIYTF